MESDRVTGPSPLERVQSLKPSGEGRQEPGGGRAARRPARTRKPSEVRSEAEAEAEAEGPAEEEEAPIKGANFDALV